MRKKPKRSDYVRNLSSPSSSPTTSTGCGSSRPLHEKWLIAPQWHKRSSRGKNRGSKRSKGSEDPLKKTKPLLHLDAESSKQHRDSCAKGFIFSLLRKSKPHEIRGFCVHTQRRHRRRSPGIRFQDDEIVNEKKKERKRH